MSRRALLFALLAVTACESDDGQRDELRAAVERWQDAGIHDYGFTFVYECECTRGGAFEIIVHDDTVTSATRIGDPVPTGAEIPAMTIDEMFDVIDEALDDDPDEVDLEFHDELGHPLNVRFDPNEVFVDDEWRIEIVQLVELSRNDE